MIGQQLEPGPPASEDLDGEHSSSSPTPTAAAAAAGSEDEEEICGCVLSVRTSEDIISVGLTAIDEGSPLTFSVLGACRSGTEVEVQNDEKHYGGPYKLD